MILAGNNRIKEKGVIDKVKSKGRVLQSENFGVAYLKRAANDNNCSRFAFIISTKISKLAVHRNRINRLLQEGVRKIIDKIPNGYDFVFLAKKSLDEKNSTEIIEEVKNFFLSVKIFYD